MELHDALKQIIESYGVDVLHDNRLPNILGDYKAFDEVPASKYILRDIITEGILGRLSEKGNQEDLEIFIKSLSSDISNKYGYIPLLVYYVLNSTAYALELTSKKPTIYPLSSNVNQEMKSKGHLSFKRISFSENIEDFVKKLEKSGFTQDDIDKKFFYGRLNQVGGLSAHMKGTFAGVYGCDVDIISRRHSRSISCVGVLFPYCDEPIKKDEWEEIKKRYLTLKKKLTNKYGLPLQKYEELCKAPELDGFENDLEENECKFEIENGSITLSWLGLIYEDKTNMELDEIEDIADL